MPAVLQSPSYQPAVEFTRWLDLNKRALIARWWECSNALSIAGDKLGVQADEVEFDAFCRTQFDLSRPLPDGVCQHGVNAHERGCRKCEHGDEL